MMRWRNNTHQWGVISLLLHWLSALVLFAMFALGLWMTDLNYYHSWYHDAPALHKGVGVLLLIVTLFRLLWRLLDGRPVELPEHLPWERIVAKYVHIFLYFLLFVVMISGYLISTADGRPLSVFGWFSLPATLHGIKAQEDLAGTVHLLLAIAFIALALLHAVAALKHHFIDRDRTLRRMLGA